MIMSDLCFRLIQYFSLGKFGVYFETILLIFVLVGRQG